MVKLSYILATSWREVPLVEVVEALPSPERLMDYIDTRIDNSLTHGYGFTSLPLLAAEACETRLERPEEALAYADLALSGDTPSRRDLRPTTVIQAQTLRGRVLAQQGRRVEAEAAFESDVEAARRHGLPLLELLAECDLRRTVLAPGRPTHPTIIPSYCIIT